MTQKIEVIGRDGKLGGPWQIKIDGKTITDVEDYELTHGSEYVHRVTFTMFTNNFQLRTEGKQPENLDPKKFGSIIHMVHKAKGFKK